MDTLFSAARRDMLEVGTVPETVVLLDGDGSGLVIANLSSLPLRAAPGRLAGQVQEHRAVAAVHLCRLTAVGGARVPQPLRELLVAAGYWPAHGYSRVRAAQVVHQGGTVDLAEMRDSGVIVQSWLAELLPSAAETR
ncbi:hypothetical protein [Actinomadura hibisca]|uniref:hypothetical protein n=1 Tax=Actinomadura hibisca TaxID=68565 RepID=UPI0008323F88|nr:hypothetical protein [Actinomadura hibisca]